MKHGRCIVAVAFALALSGCGGGKSSLYGCWEQTGSSEAGLIRWNSAGYSEVEPKSDEVLLISRDGWFDVYGKGRLMIHTRYTGNRTTVSLEMRGLELPYRIHTNILTVTALDRKTTTYRKLTPEEKTAFLAGLGDSKPAYSTDD